MISPDGCLEGRAGGAPEIPENDRLGQFGDKSFDFSSPRFLGGTFRLDGRMLGFKELASSSSLLHLDTLRGEISGGLGWRCECNDESTRTSIVGILALSTIISADVSSQLLIRLLMNEWRADMIDFSWWFDLLWISDFSFSFQLFVFLGTQHGLNFRKLTSLLL